MTAETRVSMQKRINGKDPIFRTVLMCEICLFCIVYPVFKRRLSVYSAAGDIIVHLNFICITTLSLVNREHLISDDQHSVTIKTRHVFVLHAVLAR
uniref:Uncharacterized protein n=1 Tax=Labrus bergylta TaxID=56723 RepID=A0A3Q3FQB1_9LABR